MSDRRSHYLWIRLLRKKSDCAHKLSLLLKAIIRRFGNRPRVLETFTTDNGGEFCSDYLESFYADNGITHKVTPAHTPQFNGFEERFHRTINGMALSMRSFADLPKSFWGLAWEYSVHLLNKLPTSGVPDDKTPFELFYGTKPDMKLVKIWGCPCEAMVLPEDRRDKKQDYRSISCKFVGYDEKKRCFKLVTSDSYRIVKSRDVCFDETFNGKYLNGAVNDKDSAMGYDHDSGDETKGEQHENPAPATADGGW